MRTKSRDSMEVEELSRSDSNNDNSFSDIKTHEEILDLLDKVRQFEERVPEYKISDIDSFIDECEEPSLGHVEKSPSSITKDRGQPSIIRFLPRIRIRRKLNFRKLNQKLPLSDKSFIKKEAKGGIAPRSVKPTVFNFELGNDGNLVNLNARKTKSHDRLSLITKKLGFLDSFFKKLKKGKKGEKESSPLFSSIKEKIGKIGNLKSVIPFKKKKE